MNEVDIAILTVIALSAFFGLWRGLIKEVLSLVTWIAALVIAGLYSSALEPLLDPLSSNATVRYVAAFAILFIITMIVGSLISFFISKLIDVSGLKFADRIFGGAFGVVRGIVIIMVIMMLTSSFVAETRYWQESRFVPYGLQLIEWSRLYISDYGSISEVI